MAQRFRFDTQATWRGEAIDNFKRKVKYGIDLNELKREYLANVINTPTVTKAINSLEL